MNFRIFDIIKQKPAKAWELCMRRFLFCCTW